MQQIEMIFFTEIILMAFSSIHSQLTKAIFPAICLVFDAIKINFEFIPVIKKFWTLR